MMPLALKSAGMPSVISHAQIQSTKQPGVKSSAPERRGGTKRERSVKSGNSDHMSESLN